MTAEEDYRHDRVVAGIARDPAVPWPVTLQTRYTFLIDSGITDQAQHQVGLYLVDWDTAVRRETIDVVDANATCSKRGLRSSFNAGGMSHTTSPRYCWPN